MQSKIISEIEKMGIGHGTTNYETAWCDFLSSKILGRPVPVYYKEGMPYTCQFLALPLELPEVEKYLPTEDGDPPLGNMRRISLGMKRIKKLLL